MGITLELLMVADADLNALLQKPQNARTFIRKTWSDQTSESRDRSFGIKNEWSQVNYVLRAGVPAQETPLGFLEADERIVGKVKRVRRMKVGDETVQWNEYEREGDFEYGPPSALLAARVAEINRALTPVDDERVRAAYNIDQLTTEAERGRLTAADYEERIRYCQETVQELKAFIRRTANAQLGLLRYVW